METKINVAKILKNKPEGTKLWTDMFGSVTLYVVTDKCDAFQVKHHNKIPWFDENGKMYEEGVLCIYPSKSMRDWSKFAWKKGDVLVSKDNVHIIFEKFEDDAYTRFKGKHYLWKYCDEEDYNKEETKMLTSVFEKANDDVAQTYIKTIEEKLGGKLNRKTLKIEKVQQKFKNGDIVTIMPRIGDKLIYLFKAEDNEKYYGHAFLDGNIAIVNEDSYCQKDFSTARPSTEEEKQQLFSALAKKGKAWDAENKEVADLKPKVKPFDRVLVRDSKSDNWRANLFGYIGKDGYYHCVYANWVYCIPYNEETAHLLGTTDEWKGGER